MENSRCRIEIRSAPESQECETPLRSTDFQLRQTQPALLLPDLTMDIHLLDRVCEDL